MESLFYRKDKRLQIYKIINKEQVEVPFNRNPAQIILEKRKCELREKETEEKCKEMDRQTKEAVEKHWDELSEKLENFYNAHEGLKGLISATGEILR